MPKLTVLIPLFNKAQNIEATINSVLSQSFSDFELVIINDGSTDESLDVAQGIHDSRIKIFSKENEGVSKTRNYGVTKANTEYICFLDADDIWYKHHLETLNQLITAFPNHEWFATAYEKKYNKNLIKPFETVLNTSFEAEVDNYFKHSLVDSLAWTSAVCMHKDFFTALKGFDTTITHGAGEDTDLWIKAALASPLVFSNTITAQYNLEGVNRISNTDTKKRTFINLDQYEEASKKDVYLKHYLDANRYAIGLKYKIIGDGKTAKRYFEKINLENLNRKQKFLMKSNRNLLPLLLNVQRVLRRLHINLTAFK